MQIFVSISLPWVVTPTFLQISYSIAMHEWSHRLRTWHLPEEWREHPGLCIWGRLGQHLGSVFLSTHTHLLRCCFQWKRTVMKLSLSSYEMFMRLRHTLPSHLKKNIKTKNHFDKLNLSHFNEMRKTNGTLG